jgi:hypothetical protein
VLIDAPIAALAMIECLIYLKVLDARECSPLLFGAAGVLAGLSTGFRYTAASFILPFTLAVFGRRRTSDKIVAAAALLGPTQSLSWRLLPITGTYSARQFELGIVSGCQFHTTISTLCFLCLMCQQTFMRC